MARSLTVQHEETVGTSALLNGFLLFAFGWLLLTAMTWDAEAEVREMPAAAEAGVR